MTTEQGGLIDLTSSKLLNVMFLILGLPEPSTNHLILIPEVIFSSIPVAVVSIVISTGLGTMFGSKHGYSVPPNPECIAQVKKHSTIEQTLFIN